MVNLEKEIRQFMSDYRYNHTLSVVNECKNLATLIKVDEEKLIIAAYLHDITKEMPIDSQLSLCKEMGIKVDKDTLDSPKTLHSFTAPALIMRDFPQYADEEILSAVRYHTTGRADMTLTEKLLYLADYIEPTRVFDDCKELREFFYTNTCEIKKKLNDTIVLSLKYTISDLLKKGEFIHPKTIECYNSFVKRTGD